MKTCSIILVVLAFVAICIPSSLAHTYLSSISVNGNWLPEGDCLRPYRSSAKEYPIASVLASDMTCGWLPDASRPANRKCAVAAGSTVGLQWHHTSTAASDQIVAASHQGPCIVYMAKSSDGQGPVWFKIFEEGYNPSTRKWCVDRLRENGGKMSVVIPNDIEPGNYLLRGEIIALHEGFKLNGAQMYVLCAELTVSGTGRARPSGVSFPGAYQPTDPGVKFDLYQSYSSYPIPGPALYRSGSTSTPTSSPTTAPTTAPTSAPTTAPTSAPAPTTSSSSSIKVQLHNAANVFWFAVAVQSGSVTTNKVELKDAGSYSSWTATSRMDWGYFVFPANSQLKMPISLRLTSSSGQQVVLTNVFTSWTMFSLIDTGATYGSTSTTTPTAAPTTAPTSAPTTAPTTAPSGTAPSVRLHDGCSVWWFAVAVADDTRQASKVELKDSSSYTSWQSMSKTSWGYWLFSTTGMALAGPITVRVTMTNGQAFTYRVSGPSGSATVTRV